jgi:hypothetical protein
VVAVAILCSVCVVAVAVASGVHGVTVTGGAAAAAVGQDACCHKRVVDHLQQKMQSNTHHVSNT